MGRAPQGRARATVVRLPNDRFGWSGLVRLLPSGRSLLIGFGLIALAAGSYVLARETPMFAVETIDVRGASPSVRAHVRAALRPLQGTSLLAIGGDSIARRLEPLADVRAARYDRHFPHTLRVFVRAQVAIAVVRRGADAWLVSGGGRVIRDVQASVAPGLPRVWVAASADLQPDGSVGDPGGASAIQALAVLRDARFPIHVRVVKTDGGELAFLLRSGLELRLGTPRLLPVKFAVAARILKVARATIPSVRYIDVSVPARPVAG
jgi:cell division protein FtsQ